MTTSDTASTANRHATPTPTPTPSAPCRRAVGGPWGRMAEKWVPDSLREARVDPGRRGAVLLTVVAAVAAVVAAIGVWRDRPETRPVQPVALAPATTDISARPGHSADPAPTAASSGARAIARDQGRPQRREQVRGRQLRRRRHRLPRPAPLYVSVTGLVRKPGLVRLPPDPGSPTPSRRPAGSPKMADVTGMNLAALLSDGDSVVVGGSSAGSVSGHGQRHRAGLRRRDRQRGATASHAGRAPHIGGHTRSTSTRPTRRRWSRCPVSGR